ncbi:MAG: carboxymethylenebutenolidase [Gemmatimonas sp. SG8_17]|nr:MAG: carboxymethylenebutenolidase [Gemmatimonas sp. SG8_17]
MDPRIDQQMIDLYDKFTHGDLHRRDFLDRLARLLGSSSAAMAVLPFLQNDYTKRIVSQQDDRLTISQAEWDADGTKMGGYLARLKGGEKRPGVIVIHENRGLNPHIRDVARRVALEGFLALAPDILSPQGGTPSDEGRAREMMGGLNAAETLVRLSAAVPFLAGHPESTGKVGAVGFCWGGGYANQLAAAGTSLNASVPYYGRQIPAEQVPNITAALCLHYAGLDERINAGIADYEAALKANNKTYELYMYEGAQHAFNNDTNQARYSKEAADLAWSRTIAFLKRHLAA